MDTLLILLTGFLFVSIFDAIGAILSRILNFNYALLIIGSITIYGLVAFYCAKSSSFGLGVLSAGLIAVFDSTIGFIISKKLKANIPKVEGADFHISFKLVFTMFLFGCAIGFISIRTFG